MMEIRKPRSPFFNIKNFDRTRGVTVQASPDFFTSDRAAYVWHNNVVSALSGVLIYEAKACPGTDIAMEDESIAFAGDSYSSV